MELHHDLPLAASSMMLPVVACLRVLPLQCEGMQQWGAAAMQQASGMTAAALRSADLPYAIHCSWLDAAGRVAVPACCAQRAAVGDGRDQNVEVSQLTCAEAHHSAHEVYLQDVA